MHVLQTTIRRLARREWRLLLLRSVALCVAVVVFGLILAGTLDYWVRYREPGLRWLVSLGVLAIAVVAIARLLAPVLTFHRSDVSTALSIEKCYPQLGDRLSSAVAFLETDDADAHGGSPRLRAALIEEVTAELANYRLEQCLSPQSPRRAMMLALVAVAVAMLLTFINPAAVRLASQRLAMPWAKLDWPRRNSLVFVDPPTHLGPGKDFEAILIDRNDQLPEAVEIHYWFDGDPPSAIETYAMRFAGGRMTHRLANVHRSFRYRAVGGDDDTMPWQLLTLVEPPSLERFTVRVQPPAYARTAEFEASGPVQALAGSRLDFRGRVDRPLSKITLHTQPAGALASDSEKPVAGELLSGGREFRLPADGASAITVQQSGTYWLTMTDERGRRFASQRWELRAITDQPPSVRLATISSTGVITPSAIVPIEAAARDDLDVVSLELLVRLPDGREETYPLASDPPGEPQSRTAESSSTGDELRASTTWDAGTLELAPGTVLEIAAVARDSKPQVASSSAQRVRIIAPEELEQRMAQAQASIVARLLEAIRVQREARQQAVAISVQLELSTQLARPQIDQLQSAEMAQRRTSQILGEGSDSVLSQVQQLRAQLEINQAGSSEVRERLTEVARELWDIEQQLLPQIQRELLAATKLVPRQLEPAPVVPAELPRRLEAATAGQQTALARLEGLAERLNAWEDFRRLVRDVEQLGVEQHRLAQATAELQPQTLGRELLDLPAPIRTQLRQLGRRQSELARRYDSLLGRLEARRQALAATDSQTAQRLADAVEQARSDNIGGTMRTSSTGLEQNRLAEALRRQNEATAALEKLADTLLARRATSAAERAAQLQRTRDELAQIREEQAALNAALAELQREADEQQRAERSRKVAEQQRRIAEQTGRLERQASRAGSAAARELEQATGAMQDAANSVERSLDEAQPRANEALEALASAEARLDAELGQVGRQQLRQQIEQTLDEISRVEQQQRELLQGTMALDDVQREQGSLSASQRLVLEQLAQRQRQLAQQVESQRAALGSSLAFSMHLDAVQQDMRQAAELLEQENPGEETRQWQQSAVDRLERLRMAAAPQAAPPDASENLSSTDSPSSDQTPPADSVPALSLEELKLIRLAQESLLERTIALQEVRSRRGSWTAAEQRQAERLAAEQGQLSELVDQLLSKGSDTPSSEVQPEQPSPADREQLLRDLDENLLP